MPGKPLSLSFVCLSPDISYLPISFQLFYRISIGFVLIFVFYLCNVCVLFVFVCVLLSCLYSKVAFSPWVRLGFLPGSTLHLSSGITCTSLHHLHSPVSIIVPSFISLMEHCIPSIHFCTFTFSPSHSM